MSRISILFLVAALSFRFGLKLFGTEATNRNPAAVPQISESTKNEVLKDKNEIVNRILASTLTERRATGIALKLGSGDHCEKYDQVVITLIGEGVASHGEPAELAIVAPCREWVLLPLESVYKSLATDGPINVGSSEVTVFAKHITDDWPPEWYVGSVAMVNSNDPNDMIKIDNIDFRRAKGQPVAFSW